MPDSQPDKAKTTDTPPSLTERFKLFWDLQKHEDNLINLRTNWTLAIQGLLFATLASMLGLFEKFKFPNTENTPIHKGLFIICALGFLSCVAAYLGVKAAEMQQEKNAAWWSQQLMEFDKANDTQLEKVQAYPPAFRHDLNKSKVRQPSYFIVIASVWVIVALFIWKSPTLEPRASTHTSLSQSLLSGSTPCLAFGCGLSLGFHPFLNSSAPSVAIRRQAHTRETT